MRLPLFATLILLIFSLAVDFYLWRWLLSVSRSKFLPRFQAATAVIFNVALLIIICLPKREGDNIELERLMWSLYAYFSIYVPKYIFVIFSLLASLPTLVRKKRIKWLSFAGMILAFFAFVAMWWGALINRFNIDVNRIEINVENLPASFDGFTIAQFSDLHVGTFGSDTAFVSKIVNQINSLSPDLVVFAGDIVNRKTAELYPFVETLSRLHGRYGVYSILGNHDYGDYYNWSSVSDKERNMDEMKSLQSRMGWKMLNNESVFITVDNDSIALIGVENVGDPPFNTYGDLDKAYSTLDDQYTKILLSHNPSHWVDDIKDSPDKNIALTLSGHTHAMQISAIGISPAALRYQTWGGHYKDDDSHQLYVNIGAGEVAIPARIGATPEITLITLRRK